MQIQLLKNTYKTNSFTRNFVKQATLEGTLKEGSDVLNPSILIDISNPTDYNMMYIPDFKRYYFIGWTNVNNNFWRAYSTGVDVLFTYKSKILALNAVIDKQENIHNDFIDDGSYVREVDTYREVKDFSGGFDADPSYILITA